MKIVHFTKIYKDDWGYHENLLPKYHKKLGNDVWIIAGSDGVFGYGNNIEYEDCIYDSKDGIHIIRMKPKNSGKKAILFGRYFIYNTLKKIKPDYIFVHGITEISPVFQALVYRLSCNKKCIIAADNHDDEYNTRQHICSSFKERLYYRCLRLFRKFVLKNIDQVFGVLDCRTEYAINKLQANAKNCSVLYMGADDELIKIDQRESIRHKICEDNKIDNNSFLIVSGGKLDRNKHVLELISAFKKLTRIDTVLLLFGSVEKDIENDFFEAIHGNGRIIYLGFLNQQEIYDVFLSSDLACFPGGHSVLWEQAVGTGLPCVFAYRKGMTHVDLGGNCLFFDSYMVDEIVRKIEMCLKEDKYKEMKRISEDKGMDFFSYRSIAIRSLAIKDR